MFSSLPSASKIYVSSAKTRQKSASSAKKRRRKVQPNPNYEHNTDETLISIANNENEPNNDVSSRSSDLQSEFASSSNFYWERDDSSSEYSLPTVKVVNRRRSHAHDESRKEDPIDENPVISRRRSLAIVEKQVIQSEQPSNNNINRHRIPSVDVTLKELDVESREETDDFQQREALNSPSLEVNGNDEDSAICNGEKLSVELARISSPDIPDTILSNPADNEIESENTDLKGSELENARHLVEDLKLDETNLNQSTPADAIECTECNTAEVPEVIISEAENQDSEDFDVNLPLESSSHSSISKSEGNLSKESIHEEGELHACVNSNESLSSVGADLCPAVNPSERNPDDDSHDSKESILSETDSLNNNLLTADGIQSPEQSELSCTESMINESRSTHQEFKADTPLNESETIVDCSNNTDTTEENIHEKNHSSICQSYSDLGKPSVFIGPLRRSTSWPESLHRLEKNAHYQGESISKCTSFSDKATFTVNSFCDKCDKESLQGALLEEGEEKVPEMKQESKAVSVSFKEVVSQNILPPLAMLQARSRSYVFGSMGPKGSLLGNDELSRFFPDNQITIFVGTWNMNGQDPPKSIDDFLLPLNINTLPDIYAIGVQESMQSRSEWEILLQTTLGPSHVLFTSSSLGVLHLSIFLRRDLIWFCSEPEEASVTTRAGSMVKTKGAVAICFMFFGTSFLFVNSHLTAHEQKLKERLSDYEKICSSLDLPKLIPLKSHNRKKDVTSRFDCVFWCGDLNFRVIRDRPSVLSFVDQKIRKPLPSCSFLIKCDQLHKAMAEGVAFHGFKEGVINFIPSYKFDVGTSTFDSAKLRVPSYTDRILYRCKEKSSISCLHYDAASDILTSDHKPVFAVFKVSLKPGRDNVPLAGGMFKRDIYLEAIKRRAKFLEVRQNHGQSAICSVM